MQRLKILGIGFAVLSVPICLVVISSGRAPARLPAGDDLQALFDQYTTELASYRRSSATDRQLVGFYARWLDRFTNATASLSPTEVPDSVRFAHPALASGAGEFEFAEQIASDGATHAALPAARLSFHQQRLFLLTLLSARSGGSGGESVQRAADEACGAARIMASEPGFGEDASAVLDLVSTFGAACQVAGGDQNAVIALCAEAADLIRSVSRDVWEQVGWSWAPERWHARAAEEAINSGDVEGALGYLQDIDRLPVVRESAASHALVALGDASRGAGFHPDLGRAWLQTMGPARTGTDVRIAYHLGFWLSQCSIQPGDTMEGIGLLESVLASPALDDADSEAFVELRRALSGQPARWQLEPVRSGALTALALAYLKIGLQAEARDVARQALQDYPEHPSAQAMQAIVDAR